MEEKNLFRRSIVFPILFVSTLWLIKLAEEYFHLNLFWLGIRPRTVEGLLGIFTAPFIHGSYDHLLSNTLPLLVVGTGLIYFYKDISIEFIAILAARGESKRENHCKRGCKVINLFLYRYN